MRTLAFLARHRPVSFAALLYLCLVVAAALAAPLVAPYPPLAANLADSLQGPGARHLLGTDQLGRDVLSRLIWGARPTLLFTAEAVAVTIAVGLCAGLLAGFVGRGLDTLITTSGDLVMSMPGLVVLLIVLAVFQTHILLAMICLGLLLAPSQMRVVRGAALDTRREAFVDAAHVAGLSTTRVVTRHVLPRIRGAVLVNSSMLGALALLAITGLAYLGFGTMPPQPSWGLMVGDAAQVMTQSPWPLLSAGGAVALTVMAFGLLGDGLRDASVVAWAGERPAGRPAAPVEAPDPRSGSDPDPAALLSLRSVAIAYPRAGRMHTVVRGVDLDIAPGETVGLIGESGSGKTAVARAILGILRTGGAVTAGRIAFDGKDLTAVRGGGIGYIAQEPVAALDPTWRVGALLAESVRHHTGHGRARSRQRALELLELVRLPDPHAVARAYPHELSGGMAQRVALARALAGNPRLLIADEPTSALDVTVQAAILDLLAAIRAQTGMAILLITHDWGVVADLCERVVVMYAGEIVEQAPVGELFAAGAHPYTRGLLAAAPSRASAGTELVAIPGAVPSPEHWPEGCHFAPRCTLAAPPCHAGPVPL
ncbi:MAG TPA: dipeptide/oligopeptide/nickel ABC transporter permease/ATP-binding protein, partial [Rugosimonospora sp.]|nr:dipeptide/oligopeptide/nickel ABC transporter permease/ATP-binding protein [Rugosimonospora sp.]